MRLVGLLLSLTLIVAGLVGVGGCKDKGDANASTDPAALKAQQDLMARRDALMAERKKLEGQKEAIETEINEVKKTGGDTTKLEKQRADIATQLEKKDTENSSIAGELSKAQALTGNVTGREADLATRERALAAREAAFSERERESIRALTAAADKFKESCNSGGTQMIVQVPAPKSGNYSRNEVDGVYGKAKKIMREKGLIPGDQWAGASLEADTQASLGKSEWSTAFVTASQLVNYATQFKVDRGFVQAKIGRLNAIVKSTKRDETVQKQLTDGLGDVMVKFGDGNHIGANAKLNQLFSLVR